MTNDEDYVRGLHETCTSVCPDCRDGKVMFRTRMGGTIYFVHQHIHDSYNECPAAEAAEKLYAMNELFAVLLVGHEMS